MITEIWSFLQDESNRTVLGWIGGGAVAVAGAIWAVVKFILSRGKRTSVLVSVKAAHGSIAAGRDIRGNEIRTHAGPKT
jgi:hypothetical protein